MDLGARGGGGGTTNFKLQNIVALIFWKIWGFAKVLVIEIIQHTYTFLHIL